MFVAARACGLPETIRGLAEVAEIDPDTLGDTLAGVRLPSQRTIARLAAVLHTDAAGLAMLLGGVP